MCLLELGAGIHVDMAGQLGRAVLVDADNRLEELVYALAAARHGGDHRRAEQFAERSVVEPVPALFDFVIHVQRHDHRQIHVDELRREVEVALQVRRVDDVEHHVGRLLDELPAHVALLGAVGREGIGAGQVDEAELVAAEAEVALAGVDGDTAVVAHVFVAARGDVEERRLAAVGVAHERHVDGAAPLGGHVRHGGLEVLLRLAFVVLVGAEGL